MQSELTGLQGVREIRILGVNAAGQEAGNPSIVDGRTIPWLQDTPAEQVWTHWKVTYRDVIVLDAENHVAGIYNLTGNDLAIPSNYNELKALLIMVAEEQAPPS